MSRLGLAERDDATADARSRLIEVARVFLKLGIGFGGPALRTGIG